MTDDPWHAQVAHLDQPLDCLDTHVARRTANLEACMGELTARGARLDARVAHRPRTGLVIVMACSALGAVRGTAAVLEYGVALADLGWVTQGDMPPAAKETRGATTRLMVLHGCRRSPRPFGLKTWPPGVGFA